MTEQEVKYQKAKERVATLRKFYIHLCVYVLVNLSLFLRNIIISPDNLWFYWPLTGWGIAIALHALSVFGPGHRFGAEWEEKKITKIMERN